MPRRPKLTLQNSLKLVEKFIKKEKIDVSQHYLSEVKPTLTGEEKDLAEFGWLFVWRHERNFLPLNIQFTVSVSGKVTKLRGQLEPQR